MGAQRANKKLLKAIGDRLREVRNEKGIKQMEAFFDTDIHVGRAEKGEKNISVSTLSDLCDYYKISLVDFFLGIKTK